MTFKEIFKLTKREILFLGVLIILYSSLAFYHLGSRTAPETYRVLGSNQEAFEFELTEAPQTITLYAPVNDSSKYVGIQILASSDGKNWTPAFDTRDDSEDYTAAMIWYTYPLKTTSNTRYIRIQKLEQADRLALAEVRFQDAQGRIIPATPLNEASATLLDEGDTVFTEKDRMNSAYFDESYFPSSALEMADGLSIAEMDHPPVGRLIIGLGMQLFGRNPFGFRFMQALFGILMLPLIYFLGRLLFSSSKWAAFITLCLSFDFMHYTQTRIGTLDAFLVFFILMMYAFMAFYTRCRSPRARKICLLISGLSMGLAIGTKWSGCYAALGLAIFYFADLIRDWLKKEPALRHQRLNECLWCILCFILIPVTIYLIAYIPYVRCMAGERGFLETVLTHQQTMLGYHTGSATHFVHPYSSKWWTWFLALKPVFYYYQAVPKTIYLYGTGNPLIWGIGLLGCLYTLFKVFSDHDQNARLIAIGYFSQLIPWFLITRDTFLYHYFPMVPFLILGLGYLLKNAFRNSQGKKWRKRWCLTFLILVILCFVLAFPFLYGSPMTWQTVLNLRAAFLILTGIMSLFLLIILIYDRINPHKKQDL